MADIELVIKIPEETVNEIKDNAMFSYSISSDIRWDVTSAIVNGTQLPKGHGRLIDEKDLSLMTVHLIDGVFVCDAQTIIEADKTEGSDKE